MKKIWLFLFSIFIALTLAIYNRRPATIFAQKTNPAWKTFVKNSDDEITEYKTTEREFATARISTPKRGIAEENGQGLNNDRTFSTQQEKMLKENHFLVRENRVLIGDIQKNNYQDENVNLEMLNKINPNWKNILGHELLRFQNNETKVLIKEEFPIIQIQNGKGRYVEQVIVTYVLKDGTVNSYHALIDSETSSLVDTWDKTIHENKKKEKIKLTIPFENKSGIIVR